MMQRYHGGVSSIPYCSSDAGEDAAADAGVATASGATGGVVPSGGATVTRTSFSNPSCEKDGRDMTIRTPMTTPPMLTVQPEKRRLQRRQLGGLR